MTHLKKNGYVGFKKDNVATADVITLSATGYTLSNHLCNILLEQLTQ